MPDNMPDKIETLRALASRLAGKGHVRALGQGDWEYVQYREDADDGEKWSDIHFDDAESYLAMLDPATVLKLLDVVDAAQGFAEPVSRLLVNVMYPDRPDLGKQALMDTADAGKVLSDALTALTPKAEA